MPTWHSLLNEIKERGSTFDVVRRERLKTLSERTGRNVVIYYSGWLQKPKLPGTQVSDADKNGFMTVIHGLERSKGLDLLLHTPGGETAATESLVGYLRSMFGHNIRAIVPELAMSAGTMIACACREIVMGKHSSLGPIDPQLAGIAAHGVVEEFNRAHMEIKADQTRAFVWQPIIAKYSPTLIGECEKAIQWSNEMAREWLTTGMLKDDPKRDEKAQHIVEELGDHALTKSHARHLSAKRCKDIGLNITQLEDDQQLQDVVLSVHHACILTLAGTGAFKIIENQNGVATVSVAQQVVLQGPAHSPLLEP
jgi:ATP-dependent protease ClpP protease subunit